MTWQVGEIALRLEAAELPAGAKAAADRELRRLRQMQPMQRW